MLNQKRAQFWYADFLLAILILVAISFLFIKNITDLNSKQDRLEWVANDAISISNSLMSEGYCPSNPFNTCYSDWLILTGRIGFVKQGRVIQNNLVSFIDLTQTSYDTSKIFLGTKNNYIFYFEDENGNKITINGIANPEKIIYGNPSVNQLSDINAESLVKITRFLYLDNNGLKKIVKLVVIAW